MIRKLFFSFAFFFFSSFLFASNPSWMKKNPIALRVNVLDLEADEIIAEGFSVFCGEPTLDVMKRLLTLPRVQKHLEGGFVLRVGKKGFILSHEGFFTKKEIVSLHEGVSLFF